MERSLERTKVLVVGCKTIESPFDPGYSESRVGLRTVLEDPSGVGYCPVVRDRGEEGVTPVRTTYSPRRSG